LIPQTVNGNTGIALGNLVGSNIFNILVILGVSASITPLAVKTKTTWIEIPICLLSATLLVLFAFLPLTAGKGTGLISTVAKPALIILVSLIMLIVGGRFIVMASVSIAGGLGISERIIGLTIVATGTSLPELATSIAAASKGKTDIAIGNILGSNIFNVCMILGLTALINPLPVSAASAADLFVNLFAIF